MPRTAPIAFNSPQFIPSLDLNRDNTIDLCELKAVAAQLPCNCAADIAYDDGEYLPPYGSFAGTNAGVNEGDFNAFFNAFFLQHPAADIADDQGNPFPSGNPNNGVNEGDYNLFFNIFFNSSPLPCNNGC